MILNQLNFHDFDFDLKSSQIWFYPTLLKSHKYVDEMLKNPLRLGHDPPQVPLGSLGYNAPQTL